MSLVSQAHEGLEHLNLEPLMNHTTYVISLTCWEILFAHTITQFNPPITLQSFYGVFQISTMKVWRDLNHTLEVTDAKMMLRGKTNRVDFSQFGPCPLT